VVDQQFLKVVSVETGQIPRSSVFFEFRRRFGVNIDRNRRVIIRRMATDGSFHGGNSFWYTKTGMTDQGISPAFESNAAPAGDPVLIRCS
jgi:hypothetical protein